MNNALKCTEFYVFYLFLVYILVYAAWYHVHVFKILDLYVQDIIPASLPDETDAGFYYSYMGNFGYVFISDAFLPYVRNYKWNISEHMLFKCWWVEASIVCYFLYHVCYPEEFYVFHAVWADLYQVHWDIAAAIWCYFCFLCFYVIVSWDQIWWWPYTKVAYQPVREELVELFLWLSSINITYRL